MPVHWVIKLQLLMILFLFHRSGKKTCMIIRNCIPLATPFWTCPEQVISTVRRWYSYHPKIWTYAIFHYYWIWCLHNMSTCLCKWHWQHFSPCRCVSFPNNLERMVLPWWGFLRNLDSFWATIATCLVCLWLWAWMTMVRLMLLVTWTCFLNMVSANLSIRLHTHLVIFLTMYRGQRVDEM